jgi:formyltetrahydrofolate deformylase
VTAGAHRPGPPPDLQPRVLLVDCQDEPGLIHRITGVLLGRGANIVTNAEFVERDAQHFFMRSEFVGPDAAPEMVRELQAVLPPSAGVRIESPGRHRIVALASAEHHCLAELLVRHAHGELGASLEAVVSNHDALAELTGRFAVPFHHVSHHGLSRPDHEAALLAVLEGYAPDYIVLAKYMRILSAGFVERFRNRIVNIHHSFLPAFVGANPYRQAYERGVKIIGATAHFVTEMLDEGPIVAQAVVPVDHNYGPGEMAQAGRDIEKIVLARALKLVFEDRVFFHGNRTVVFD